MPKKCGHFGGKELIAAEAMQQPMLAMHKAVKEMLEVLMREGCSTSAIAERLTPFDEFNEFIGLPEVIESRRRFAS